MPNLFAPKAPLPPLGRPADEINYKATALSWAIACAFMFAMDIRAQKQDQRAAQALADQEDEADVRGLFHATFEPKCISEHCREGRHVYRDFASAAVPADEEHDAG